MDPDTRQQPSFLAPEEVRNYVNVDRNLERDKPTELVALARRIRGEREFEYTYNGRHFKVVSETAPELDFFVAGFIS